MNTRGWGGPGRAGAGRRPGPAPGPASERVRFDCSPDYLEWYQAFAERLEQSEAGAFRMAMRHLASSTGFRSPPSW